LLISPPFREIEIEVPLIPNAESNRMPKKRVLVVINTVTPYTSQLYSRVAERNNIDLMVLYCSKGHRNRPVDWQNACGTHSRKILPGLHLCIRGGSRDPIHINPSIASELKQFQPDVVVVHGYSDLTNLISLLVCRISGTPSVLEVDGGDYERHSRITRILVRSVVRSCSGFIAASQGARDFLCRYDAPLASVTIIPCTTNLSEYHDLSMEIRGKRDDFRRAKRGSESRPRSLLYVGRLVEEKGVLDLLQAFREIREEYRHLRLVILGRGPLAPRVRRDCGVDFGENVIHLDHVSDHDLVELYSTSDVLVLPSHREPYGIVAMEAFVCGIPVIITDRCGCSSALPRSPWVIRSRAGDIPNLCESIRSALEMTSSDRSLDDPEILKVLWENSSDKMAHDFEDSIFRLTSAPTREDAMPHPIR